MRLMVTLVLTLDPIGSGLSDGVSLVYASGAAVQEPWIYESVRVVARDEFPRCVVYERRGQAEREACVRGDTLFERRAGEYVATRPIGPDMRMEVRTPSGSTLQYSTGPWDTARLQGRTIRYLPTTITTRTAEAQVTRRLREHYAPSLLTALWGVFEEPDDSAGWKTVREFTLVEVRHPAERTD